MTSGGGYGPELAQVHHTGFGWLARATAPVVVDALRPRHASGLVVDLGCGSGILAAALVDAGYDVLGVDASADMLALARTTAPRARWLHASLFDVAIPDCVAVTAIGECVGYAFDARAGRDGLTGLVRRVHRALAPGGVFVFDVAGPGRAGAGGRSDGVHDHGDSLVTARAVEDPATATLRRDITVFRRDGDRWRRIDESHVLHLHPPEEVEGLLTDAGFDVHRLRGYGEVPFPDGWTGFVARR